MMLEEIMREDLVAYETRHEVIFDNLKPPRIWRLFKSLIVICGIHLAWDFYLYFECQGL